MALRLPRLSTERWARLTPPEPGRPRALFAKNGGAYTLAHVDAAAEDAGLRVGISLADARAIAPRLQAEDHAPDADARALDRIAAWCERITPFVALDPPDALALDIGGCAHLFGGEAALMASVRAACAAQGLTARIAIAPNPDAAWALAVHRAGAIVEAHELHAALAPLPVEALRLAPEAAALLKRLGLKTIGQIMDAPRAPFAARAGQSALRRLDLALGRAAPVRTPRRPPPPIYKLRRLAEPIVTLDAVLTVTQALCADLCAALKERGLGARRVRLLLFGVDARTRRIDLGLSRPEISARALLALLRERLAAAAEHFDAAFGFEILRLDACETAPLEAHGAPLTPERGHDPIAEARLLDTLTARLGADAAKKLAVGRTHRPEGAALQRSAGKADAPTNAAPAPHDGLMRRPLTLFARPQPIEAIASVPDGPPLRFRWRRVLREVARAEGPERLEGDWLRTPEARVRDYYRVEDAHGRRYWLFREGHYSDAAPPRWMLHGLFA